MNAQHSLAKSRLGIGMAALGRPGYITLGHQEDTRDDISVGAMERRAHEVLDAAYAAGIRYFDAARSYGRAEEFLSHWLAAHEGQLGAITVASKWGYTYTADWQIEAEHHEVKEHSLPNLQKQWTETQALLGDHIDLYQIHSATFSSGVLDNQDVLNELARMKADGVRIGLSLSGPDQGEVLRKAASIQADGQMLFDAVQATWNLLERSAGDALREVHELGMAVIIKESVANGRLTDRNQNPAFASHMARLHSQAQRLDTTIDALAIAGVLAQRWVDVVLIGAGSISQVQSNVKALAVGWDAEAADVLASMAEPAEQYWQQRSALTWN